MQSQEAASAHTFADYMRQYLEWGRARGGKKGLPWSPKHARMNADHLAAWLDSCEFKTLAEITLAKAETYLNALAAETKIDKKTGEEKPKYAPASLWHRDNALRSLISWCLKREYLTKDPLKALPRPNCDPVKRKRPFTFEEFSRLLKAAPPERALLYDVAADTGLRQNELRSITVAHLDTQRGGIRVDPKWEKTRLEDFVPLSPDLCDELSARAKDKAPETPLLSVTSNPIQEFDLDLERAHIEKHTPEGTLDFHALRNTGVTWVEEHGGLSDTGVKTFGRHKTNKASARYRSTKKDAIRLAKAKVRIELKKAMRDERVTEGTRTPDLLSHSQTELAEMFKAIAVAILVSTNGTDSQKDALRTLSDDFTARIFGDKTREKP